VYGFRLINGRDVIVNTEKKLTAESPTVEPFTVDEENEVIVLNQLSNFPQGFQDFLIRYISINSIVEVLVYPFANGAS
jgi:hypothetical protein